MNHGPHPTSSCGGGGGLGWSAGRVGLSHMHMAGVCPKPKEPTRRSINAIPSRRAVPTLLSSAWDGTRQNLIYGIYGVRCPPHPTRPAPPRPARRGARGPERGGAEHHAQDQPDEVSHHGMAGERAPLPPTHTYTPSPCPSLNSRPTCPRGRGPQRAQGGAGQQQCRYTQLLQAVVKAIATDNTRVAAAGSHLLQRVGGAARPARACRDHAVRFAPLSIPRASLSSMPPGVRQTAVPPPAPSLRAPTPRRPVPSGPVPCVCCPPPLPSPPCAAPTHTSPSHCAKRPLQRRALLVRPHARARRHSPMWARLGRGWRQGHWHPASGGA